MPIDSQFEFHTALPYSSMQLAQILSHCFENYIVPFVIDGETFSSRFAAEDLSLNHSIIVTHQQHPVALALISYRLGLPAADASFCHAIRSSRQQ
ncbi:Uncharacterised protein [Serratia fonticola]|nr:Uncharacterised protein [Serratia fonticola]